MKLKRTEDEYLKIINSFIKSRGIKPCRFSLDCVGNSSLVRRMKRGEPINSTTMNKIKKYLLKHGIIIETISRNRSAPTN